MSDASSEILRWSKHGDTGRNVLLLHGFANSAAWWMPWALPLARHHRVFVPDLPGHGDAQKIRPPGPDLMADIAQAIVSYVKKEGLNDICLAGFSFGAYLGQYLLLHHPELPITRFLNLEHPPWTQKDERSDFGMSGEVLAAFGEVVRLVGDDEQLPRANVKELPKEVQDAYLRAIVMIAEKSLDNQAATWLLEQVMGTGPIRRWILTQVEWAWGYAIIRAYFEGRYDFRDRLKDIRIPVWVVGTKEASLFAGDAVPFFQERLPFCQTTYFEGSSHAFLFRHPLQFNELLNKFLS